MNIRTLKYVSFDKISEVSGKTSKDYTSHEFFLPKIMYRFCETTL